MTGSSAASTVAVQAKSTRHYLAVVCEAALMLALATGFGFGFGAAVERLTTPEPAAGASAVVATDSQPDRALPHPDDFVYDGATALRGQGEIGPAITNNSTRRTFQSADMSDGPAPNELRLFGK